MLLSQLKIGQTAIIKEIDVLETPLKLIELGCIPDNKVTLLQVAPLGCPFYFLINDTRVAIRKDLAERVTIEVI